jgi:hypothetical protein
LTRNPRSASRNRDVTFISLVDGSALTIREDTPEGEEVDRFVVKK